MGDRRCCPSNTTELTYRVFHYIGRVLGSVSRSLSKCSTRIPSCEQKRLKWQLRGGQTIAVIVASALTVEII